MIALSGALDPATVNVLGIAIGAGGLAATAGWLWALLR